MCNACRDFGMQLFMDDARLNRSSDKGGIEAAFGSFLDPAFVSSEGPLGHLVGRVSHLWANTVLHIFSKPEVPVFAAHAHRMLAPGGVFFGVSLSSVWR